jgi:hypothetical protein
MSTPRSEVTAPIARLSSRLTNVPLLKINRVKAATSGRRPSIGPQIKAHFADGRWHSVGIIAKTIHADEDHVRTTLNRITWTCNSYFGCRAERKKVGTHFEYRIFKISKTISSNELIEKLTPIIEGLRDEGKKNMVTMSPQTVAVLAHRLQKLLDEWAE